MPSMVFLAGRLVAEPFFDHTAKGMPYMRIYVAVPRPSNKGEDHIRVVALNDLAVQTYPYLRPGSEVAVYGHLQVRPLPGTDGAGRSRSVMEVVAERLMFIGGIDYETGNRVLTELQQLEQQ